MCVCAQDAIQQLHFGTIYSCFATFFLGTLDRDDEDDDDGAGDGF